MKLDLRHVSHRYEETRILDDLNLALENKQAVALIGPSGAGKSTLLRLLSKIETPDQGSIWVNDMDLSVVDAKIYYKKIGFVFQSHNLFPHLTALENITLVLEKVYHLGKVEAKVKAMGLLERFDLAAHMDKKPGKLSGGQSQRVSIVRSLAVSPEVVFFDEPTSSLDPLLAQEVLGTILSLRETNVSFVIVTHEIAFARQAADHVVFMNHGKIVEHGGVEILEQPKTTELTHFLANVTF